MRIVASAPGIEQPDPDKPLVSGARGRVPGLAQIRATLPCRRPALPEPDFVRLAGRGLAERIAGQAGRACFERLRRRKIGFRVSSAHGQIPFVESVPRHPLRARRLAPPKP